MDGGVSPLDIAQVLPTQIHHYWPFIEPGLYEIHKECDTEWIPEDHYAGIYAGRVECFIFKREDRWLGFYDAYAMPVTFGKTDTKYFVWAIWSQRPKDRSSEDFEQLEIDRRAGFEFIKHRARDLGCKFIENISPRMFHKKLGFKEYATVYRLAV